MKYSKSVKDAMKQLDIKKLRPKQGQAISSILNGHDTMVIAPTSFGKSILYLIPAIIQSDKLTIVVEPLLALMHDQVKYLRKHQIAAAYLDHMQTEKEQSDILDCVQSGEIHILFVSPERLCRLPFQMAIQDISIGMVVVDECHCVISWGSTFREDYLHIGAFVDSLPKHPVVVAVTATAAPQDRERIMDLLSMKSEPKCFAYSLYRSNLTFLIKPVESRKEKRRKLQKLLKKYHANTTLIFCATKAGAEAVAENLKALYPGDVAVYHSREKKAEKAILAGKKHVIVATTALSMGVDIRNVDLVIHFDLPKSLEEYYQQAGRGGRDGQHSRSILLYDPTDFHRNYGLLCQITNKEARKRAVEQLNQMKELCDEKHRCLVKMMLDFLGDSPRKNCRYCTNCQKAR